MDELAGLGISPLAWFLALLATFSLSLGLTNLLPLPPLDGSRACMYLLETVSRRRLASPRALLRLNIAGFVVLIAVFALVTGTDVLRVLQSQPVLHIQ
jgi:regulator of sigma E protease